MAESGQHSAASTARSSAIPESTASPSASRSNVSGAIFTQDAIPLHSDRSTSILYGGIGSSFGQDSPCGQADHGGDRGRVERERPPVGAGGEPVDGGGAEDSEGRSRSRGHKSAHRPSKTNCDRRHSRSSPADL